ncbi:MAG: hypothetical protein GY795_29195 [Desulfobacterales bacterium]|nr:hypothetical protein [Desulfobacterales bacterium]
MKIPGLVSLLVGLQFAAFGWRINREISVGDRGEQTWIPLTDILNLANFCLAVIFCILIPLTTDDFGNISKAFLASGSVLIFFHPINMAAHYELFDNKGRIKHVKMKNENKELDFDKLSYCPHQEKISIFISVVLAIISFHFVLFQ